MTEWVSRPTLPVRCKIRIFKGRASDPNPWLLVMPASPTIDSKRKAIRFPDWNTAWLTAMTIQDHTKRVTAIIE